MNKEKNKIMKEQTNKNESEQRERMKEHKK